MEPYIAETRIGSLSEFWVLTSEKTYGPYDEKTVKLELAWHKEFHALMLEDEEGE